MKKSKNDELVFLPLGGSNEIGMNFNLYGFGPAHDRKWIVVDLGVTFGDQTTPGVEIILPDPTYIEPYADDILGIVLTHAHEDHLGAVHWLWPRLKAPVFATPFTAFLLREKLRFQGVIMTDDIDMAALAKDMDRKSAFIAALAAGNDLIMVKNVTDHDPNFPLHAVQWVEEAVARGTLSREAIAASARRVEALPVPA